MTKAQKSIANFKLREGMNVGAKVTLRGSRMEEFMDKLVSIALPAFATSAASATSPSTVAATTLWASVSS